MFDDPSRTADFGYFPNERWEEVDMDLEYIVDKILLAIKDGSRAYGRSATDLEEILIDSLLWDKETTLEMLSLCKNMEAIKEVCKRLAEEYGEGWRCTS